MQIVICNRCGAKRLNKDWGCSNETINVFDKANNDEITTTTVDLCLACYEKYQRDIIKVNTKYATPKSLRKKRNENI